MRVAVVASHPVQYQAPWLRGLAAQLDLQVFFCHRQDAAGQASAGYTTPFDWDVPLLDGYTSTWLENVSASPGVGAFGGCDTPGIGDALARGRFDACIVLGWYLKSYLQAIHAARRLSLPVLLRGDSTLGTERSFARRAVKYLPYRWLLGSVAGHLVVGQRNRAYLRHYGVQPERMFDVPHAVDDRWFAAMASDERQAGARLRERAALGIPADARVALFAGRLVDSKRPLDLIRALAHPALPDDVWGLFVGSGPLESEIRALASSLKARAVFAGFRNQRALPACYVAADWLVLPSDGRETWGLVANEALACGLPVVVSQSAGCAADLAVGLAGRTFPTGEIGALAAAMAATRADVASRADQVRAAVDERSRAFGCERAVQCTVEAVGAVTARLKRTGVPTDDLIRSNVKVP
jgi:glycosyltransferase involved in cell wall biosynthesis